MRPLEILTQVALLAALLEVRRRAGPRPRLLAVFSAVSLLSALAHLAVEGWRFQMVTTYALVVLLALAALRSLFLTRRTPENVPRTTRRARLWVLIGLLILADAALQLLLFPVFRLPEPSGPYPVGTAHFTLVDLAREERFTPDPGDRRKLLVQAWYPADAPGGKAPAPYWEGAPFYLNHLRLVATHSYPDAPPASLPGGFPVLVFSHGYLLGYAGQNTVLMEALASRGYAVFSLVHPYEALLADFPDGRRVPLNLSQARVLWEEQRRLAAHFGPLGLGFQDIFTDPAWLQERIDRTPRMQASLRLWVADTLFLLDWLESLQAGEAGSPLAGRLGLDRIGLMGMSFGGSTAMQVCLVDERCRAGVSLDGPVMGDVLKGALPQPFMMLYSEQSAGMNDLVVGRAWGAAYSLTLEGATHFDFTDLPLITPLLKAVLLPGSPEGPRALEVTGVYISAFFDQHLRGLPSPLLLGPSPDFSDVGFEARSPP